MPCALMLVSRESQSEEGGGTQVDRLSCSSPTSALMKRSTCNLADEPNIFSDHSPSDVDSAENIGKPLPLGTEWNEAPHDLSAARGVATLDSSPDSEDKNLPLEMLIKNKVLEDSHLGIQSETPAVGMSALPTLQHSIPSSSNHVRNVVVFASPRSGQPARASNDIATVTSTGRRSSSSADLSRVCSTTQSANHRIIRRRAGTTRWLLPSLLLLLTVVAASNSTTTPLRVQYDCDTCLERTDYTIRAILHGSNLDSFWKQVASAMKQVARDARIRLDIDFENDYDAMAEKVMLIADDDENADALIVSIPTIKVRNAVESIIAQKQMPVIGVNSGYEFDIPGLLGHVAMDERLGGMKAAESFLAEWSREDTNITKAPMIRRVLFINHEKGNEALNLRRLGLQEGLQEQNASAGTITYDVHELVVDLTTDSKEVQVQLDIALQFCPFDGVQLAGGSLLEVTTKAYYVNGCKFDSQILGVFDANSRIYDSIGVSKTTFCVSQQQYLQGSLTVTMAALYATTGKSLLAKSREAPFGNYLSGPQIITLANLPADTQQSCESQAFPVCGRREGNGAKDGAQRAESCECMERQRIRIGGVILDHNDFWTTIITAAEQGARDMGVKLILDPLGRDEDFDTENLRTAEKVKSLCQDGVDGVFTTIKSEVVAEAIKFCQGLHVPVITFNSGTAFAKQLGLTQHVSMDEYEAGKKAGEAFVQAGIRYGYCVNWSIDNDLTPRCNGFRDAINEAPNQDVVYIAEIGAPSDNIVLFQEVLESHITEGGESWDGVGILLVSNPFVPAGLACKEKHPNVLLGTMDENHAVHQALDNGSLLFSIDQQPYLQGYLPVVLLTWLAHTKQELLTHSMETGPMLVQKSPSEAEAQCESTAFQVCPEPFNMNQLDKIRPVGLTIMVIIILTALGFIVWVAQNRKARVVRASQPIFLVTICMGTIIMAFAILPNSLDDGVLSEGGGCLGCECPQCDVACMSSPWLVSVGFTIIFASLFSKIWRVNRLMTSASSFRRLRLSTRDVLVPAGILLGLNVTFLLIWTLVDPMYFSRTRRCDSDDFTSYGVCVFGRGTTSTVMASLVFVVNLGAVVMANYQAYKARNYGTEFSESRYIALVQLCFFQVMIVALPLLFLVANQPPVHFFVTFGYIAIICLSVLLLIFWPKVLLLKKETNTSNITTAQSSANNFVEQEEPIPETSRSSGSILLVSSGLRIRRRYSSPPAVEPSARPAGVTFNDVEQESS